MTQENGIASHCINANANPNEVRSTPDLRNTEEVAEGEGTKSI